MSRKRFFLTALAGIFCTLALTAWILDKSGIFVRALKPQVVKALSDATGRDVKVGSIEGGLFGAIVLRDLSLGYSKTMAAVDGTVQVKTAVVRFSLWDFFVLKKSALESLRSLGLETPDILVRILSLPSVGVAPPPRNWTALLSGLPLPPVSTTIDGGSVRLSLSAAGSGETIFEALDAELVTNRETGVARLSLSGRAYGGRLSIKAQFVPATASLNATLDLKALDLASLSQATWVPSAIPNLESGIADGRLSLEFSKELAAQGVLHVSGVGLKIPKAGEIKDLEADLSLEGQRLRLAQLRFQGQGAIWQGRGEVDDLSKPELALYVSSIDGRPAWGSMSVERAQLSMRASAASVDLESLTLTSGTGSLVVGGIANFISSGAASLDFEGHLSQFPVTDLAAVVDGRIRLQGDSVQPLLSGFLSSASAMIKGEAFNHILLGIDSKGGQGSLGLQADWRGLQGLKLAAQGNLQKASFSLGQGGPDWLKGDVTFANDRIQLKSNIVGIDVSTLASALGLKLRLSQPLQGSLQIQGPLKNPDMNLSLNGKLLQTDDGQAFPVLADLSIRDGVFHLDRFSARGGEIAASGGGQEYRLQFKHAELAELAALFSSTDGQMEGTLEGSVNLQNASQGWNAQVNLNADHLLAWGLRAQHVEMEGAADKQSWTLTRLEASQDEGRLQGKGHFDPLQQGSAELELTARNWKLDDRNLSFDFEALGNRPGRVASWFKKVAGADSRGAAEIGGSLKMSAIVLDGHELPPLLGDWNWFDHLELALKDLSWGSEVTAQADWRNDQGFSASLETRAAAWKPFIVLAGLDGDELSLPLNASLAVQGKGRSGEAKFSFAPGADATWHWFPGATGKMQVIAAATVKDFELAHALELVGLWAGPKFRDMVRGFNGNLNTSLAFDNSQADALSFSATVDKLHQGTDIWGPLNLQGSAGDNGLYVRHLQVGEAQSLLSIQNLKLQHNEDGKTTINVDLQANGFPDFDFMRVGGQANLAVTMDNDGGKAELRWQRLRLNRQDLDPGAAVLSWDPNHLEASEAAEPARWHAMILKDKDQGWKLDSMYAGLAKGGEINAKDGLDEEGHPRLEVSGKAVPSALIAALLDWPLELGGLVYGNAVFRIPTDSAGYLSMLLSAKVENGDLEGFPFDLATGSVKLEDGTLNLNPLGEPARVLRRNRYEAEVSGFIPCYRNDDKPLAEMDFEGHLISGNLGLIDYLDIVDSATGTVTAEAHIKGTALYPEFNGKAEVQGGQIKFKRLLAPATDVQGQLFVDQNNLEIVKLDAQMGKAGQRVFVSQADGRSPAVTFEKWLISTFNIEINSGKAGVQLQANDNYNFITGKLMPNFILGGSWEDPQFSGSAVLSDADVFYPIRRSSPEIPPNPDDFSERVLWNAKINTTGVVTLHSMADSGDFGISQNNLIKSLTRVEAVRVDVEAPEKGLFLHGAGPDFGLQGKIKVARGQLNILSVIFPINTDKDNFIQLDPSGQSKLSLWSSKSVIDSEGRNSTIDVNFSGSPGHIKVDMASSDNASFTNDQDPDEGQQEMARLIGLNADDAVGVLSGIFSKTVITSLFHGSSALDFNVSFPGLGRQGGGVSNTVDAADNTVEGQPIVNVTIGGHIPQTNLYVNAGYDQRNGVNPDSTATKYSATVELPISDKVKLDASYDNDSEEGVGGAIGISRHEDLENYDPRKRHEEMLLRRENELTSAADVSPSSSVLPSPVPTATATPAEPPNPLNP